MNNSKEKNVLDKKKIVFVSLLITLIVLFLLSLSILIIRLGNFLPNGTDILFIEPKNPEFVAEDGEKVWDGETDIKIFSISKVNDKGEITVISGNGDNIIAPGMEGYYKFSFKNLGNIAINYECDIVASFYGEGIDNIESELPFKIKLRNCNGEYVIGNEDEWASVNKIIKYTDKQTLGKSSYSYYELEWCWLYENGNDSLDTLLGNMSAESKVELIINIKLQASQNSNLDAEGGLKFEENPRTGGDIVPAPYIILNVLIFIILGVLIYIEVMRRKKQNNIVKEVVEETIKK